MRHLFTAFKLVATAVLLWYVFSRIDFAELASKVSAKDIALGLLAGAVTIVLQAIVAAVRLRMCLRMVGRGVSVTNTWIACQFGGLFSHTPISFVGGDAMRVWHVVRCGISLADAAKAVILDRAVGFVGMMCLVLVTAPVMLEAIQDPTVEAGYVALVATGIGAILGFFVLGRVPPPARQHSILSRIAEFASLSRYVALRPRETMAALGLAVVVNLFNVIAVWLIALAYGSGISLYVSMVAAPAVFLVAMIPISVAGWGLREGAIVVAFGLFGVPAEQSLTVSVTFGLAIILAYSPALVLLFRIRRKDGIPAVRPAVDQR